MTSDAGSAARTPVQQLHALGHGVSQAPKEDSPGWHLAAAEEAMDEGRWDTARAAVQRARETIEAGTPEEVEAGFVALRLAVATVDLRSATAEVVALTERMDPRDAVWNRRVRRIVAAAPRVFAAPMRTGILELLPLLPGGDAAVPHVEVPVGGLPLLPGEDDWPEPPAEEPPPRDAAAAATLRPIPTESPFRPVVAVTEPVAETAAAPPAPAASGDADEVLVWDAEPDGSDQPAGFGGRVLIPGAGADLTDADALREQLVEAMLASVSEEEGQLLFDTASTFLNNREFGSAEIMFSAAMQVPPLRVPACEGVMQALIGAERFSEAVSTGTRALRIFAREGDALLGIVYCLGIAAQAQGDVSTARNCFARVAESGHAEHFPQLDGRRAALS
jgi:hypothetical protein